MYDGDAYWADGKASAGLEALWMMESSPETDRELGEAGFRLEEQPGPGGREETSGWYRC